MAFLWNHESLWREVKGEERDRLEGVEADIAANAPVASI